MYAIIGIVILISGIAIYINRKSNVNSLQQLPDGPYFGQEPPGLEPIIFAPGIISLNNRRETKIVFSPDGQECLIGTGAGILYTNQENGHWLDPKPADFIGYLGLVEPFFSPDGQIIFFGSHHADIWVSYRVNQRWITPEKLNSPINTSAEEWHPTVTLNGTLYFCSSRNRPKGCWDIYSSKLINGNYSTVEKHDEIINSEYGAWDPFIAPDESYIIFTSIRPEGYGKEDQYISYYKNRTWSNPENLGPNINTDKIEYGSYISYDNKYYFFSRPEGWGPDDKSDIYWVDAREIFSKQQ